MLKYILMKKDWLWVVILLLVLGCSGDDDGIFAEESSELSLQQVAEESPNEVIWIPREAMKSRNGVAMGYGVLLNPNSDKLLVFLDGGGACFNGITCTFNLDEFFEESLTLRLAAEESLILNRETDANQFKDWNFVFVPYATGDVHVGSNTSVDVPNGGPTNQMMVGGNNFQVILNDLSEYFSSNESLSEIVFAGSSAGGFGVLPNYAQLKTALGEDVTTTAIVDAGQVFMDTNLLTPCLVEQWESLWNISESLPADLNAVVHSNYAYDIQKMYEYASHKYPEDNFGFLSYYQDSTNSFFYGFGQDECEYPTLGPIAGADFKEGVLDLQATTLSGLPNWNVFFKNSTSHTFLGDPNFSQTVNGTSLNDWIFQLRQGTAEDLME